MLREILIYDTSLWFSRWCLLTRYIHYLPGCFTAYILLLTTFLYHQRSFLRLSIQGLALISNLHEKGLDWTFQTLSIIEVPYYDSTALERAKFLISTSGPRSLQWSCRAVRAEECELAMRTFQALDIKFSIIGIARWSSMDCTNSLLTASRGPDDTLVYFQPYKNGFGRKTSRRLPSAVQPLVRKFLANQFLAEHPKLFRFEVIRGPWLYDIHHWIRHMRVDQMRPVMCCGFRVSILEFQWQFKYDTPLREGSNEA